MRPFLSYRASKVWLIISALLIVLAIVVNMLLTSMFSGLMDTCLLYTSPSPRDCS